MQSFKKAHNILMQDLIQTSGSFRNKGVGIIKGNETAHVAPPKRVPDLMKDLCWTL
ncbi:MAG: hypothetical protein HON32_02815 [Francisellaceae bacterium]|nr:hypothetical protein [Francisellaceae bacterium]